MLHPAILPSLSYTQPQNAAQIILLALWDEFDHVCHVSPALHSYMRIDPHSSAHNQDIFLIGVEESGGALADSLAAPAISETKYSSAGAYQYSSRALLVYEVKIAGFTVPPPCKVRSPGSAPFRLVGAEPAAGTLWDHGSPGAASCCPSRLE